MGPAQLPILFIFAPLCGCQRLHLFQPSKPLFLPFQGQWLLLPSACPAYPISVETESPLRARHDGSAQPVAGRADYYGALPNLAARVLALAAPGQVLVEGSPGGFRAGGGALWERREDGLALRALPPGEAKGLPGAGAPVELEQLGYFLLKVGRPTLKPLDYTVMIVLLS